MRETRWSDWYDAAGLVRHAVLNPLIPQAKYSKKHSQALQHYSKELGSMQDDLDAVLNAALDFADAQTLAALRELVEIRKGFFSFALCVRLTHMCAHARRR